MRCHGSSMRPSSCKVRALILGASAALELTLSLGMGRRFHGTPTSLRLLQLCRRRARQYRSEASLRSSYLPQAYAHHPRPRRQGDRGVEGGEGCSHCYGGPLGGPGSQLVLHSSVVLQRQRVQRHPRQRLLVGECSTSAAARCDPSARADHLPCDPKGMEDMEDAYAGEEFFHGPCTPVQPCPRSPSR